MTEQHAGFEPSLGASAESATPRKPFVSPTVQDLGGLTTLTLLSGSL